MLFFLKKLKNLVTEYLVIMSGNFLRPHIRYGVLLCGDMLLPVNDLSCYRREPSGLFADDQPTKRSLPSFVSTRLKLTRVYNEFILSSLLNMKTNLSSFLSMG